VTRLIADIVLDALRTFDRPATRAEIERESELGYDQVHNALRTLCRNGLVVIEVDAPRRRGLYRVATGVERSECARGRYERDHEHRQRMADAVRTYWADDGRGRAPAAEVGMLQAAPSGGARLVMKGVLDVGAQLPASWGPPLALDQAWTRGRR
jgi:hypothetical protein